MFPSLSLSIPLSKNKEFKKSFVQCWHEAFKGFLLLHLKHSGLLVKCGG